MSGAADVLANYDEVPMPPLDASFLGDHRPSLWRPGAGRDLIQCCGNVFGADRKRGRYQPDAWDEWGDHVTEAMTATLRRVSPNPKRVLSADDETHIREALTRRDDAVESVRRAVLDAVSHGASVRVLAEFTGMSTNTISRWKADARNTKEES